MSLLGVLNYEEKVQINDKTRFDLTKSFATSGETAISTLTVKPGLDGSAISVYNTDSTRWYTDWAYTSQTFDIDSTNNTIYYTEDGDDYEATVAGGTYTLATLLTAIKTALEAESGATFSVTVDSFNKITIAKTGASIVLDGLNPINNLLPHIGFIYETNASDSHEGLPVEYGIKKLVVSINNGGVASTYNFYQKVYSVLGDRLFSSDLDLISEENQILKYLPAGKSSYIYVHRRAQESILEWLDQNGYVNVNEKKFTKHDIIDISEVKAWSRYLALELIFRDFGNAKDDVFKDKANFYEKKAIAARNRMVLRLDVNEDGIADNDTSIDTWSGQMVRR